MDPEEVSLVLARAVELHSNVSEAIRRALPPPPPRTSSVLYYGREEGEGEEKEEDEEEEFGREGEKWQQGALEVHRLASVRDALESLQDQLRSLKELHHEQQAEKGVTLVELEKSRQTLLLGLKEYKGKERELIGQVFAFVAGETLEEEVEDLPLPPYPMPPPTMTAFSDSDTAGKLQLNGAPPESPLARHRDERSLEDMQVQRGSSINEVSKGEEEGGKGSGGLTGFGRFLLASASQFIVGLSPQKVVLAIVGAAAMAAFSVGVQTGGKEKSPTTACQDVSRRPLMHSRPSAPVCPPGKVMVVDGGSKKCVVKERTEIPFQWNLSSPDASYGKG